MINDSMLLACGADGPDPQTALKPLRNCQKCLDFSVIGTDLVLANIHTLIEVGTYA